MKARIIGVGQCGGYVVYDFIAFLHDFKRSSQLRAQPVGGVYHEIKERVVNSVVTNTQGRLRRELDYFFGTKVANKPTFVIVDGNRLNPLIEMLNLGKNQVRIAELGSNLRSIPLPEWNNGCAFGAIGEIVFTKAAARPDFMQDLGLREVTDTDLIIMVSSSGGGSGSGGVVALAKACQLPQNHLRPLLICISVLPASDHASEVLQWNTGRHLHRMRTVKRHDSLILFSNLDDTPQEKEAVNSLIRSLLVRIANFSYKSNFATLGRDLDRMELRSFFGGKNIVVGQSTQSNSDELTVDGLAMLVRDAIQNRRVGESSGLSWPGPAGFDAVEIILVVIGIPEKTRLVLRDPVACIINEVKAAFGSRKSLDCRLYSYGSTAHVEFTIFARFERFASVPDIGRYLDIWNHHSNGKKTESEVLEVNLADDESNTIVLDCKRTIEGAMTWDDAKRILDQIPI